MDCTIYGIYLVVMALAFLGAVVLGVCCNYRWMKRFAKQGNANHGMH